jgi:hypothetical protein
MMFVSFFQSACDAAEGGEGAKYETKHQNKANECIARENAFQTLEVPPPTSPSVCMGTDESLLAGARAMTGTAT